MEIAIERIEIWRVNPSCYRLYNMEKEAREIKKVIEPFHFMKLSEGEESWSLRKKNRKLREIAIKLPLSQKAPMNRFFHLFLLEELFQFENFKIKEKLENEFIILVYWSDIRKKEISFKIYADTPLRPMEKMISLPFFYVKIRSSTESVLFNSQHFDDFMQKVVEEYSEILRFLRFLFFDELFGPHDGNSGDIRILSKFLGRLWKFCTNYLAI